MIIERAILHIMDIDNEAVICTDQELDLTDEQVANYVLEVTQKAFKQDAKVGKTTSVPIIATFYESESNFIEASKTAVQLWHDISRGIEIPTGDYLCVAFSNEGNEYIGIFKLQHSEQVTHLLDYNDQGIVNKLIVNRTLLPKATAKLKEGLIFDQLGNYRLIETKYKVEGQKQFYLGHRLLNLDTPVHSVQESVKVVKEIVQDIAKDLSEEEYEITAKLQEAVYEAAEVGILDLETIEDKVFAGKAEVKEKFAKEVAKKELQSQPIAEQEKVIKRYAKQKFKLDNGIEIAIPMEVYQDREVVEFINNPDGSLSVLIKNIDEIKNKF